MWKREEFLIANGMSQLPNASMTNDLAPNQYFDGGLDDDLDIEFSDASGRRRRRRRRFVKSFNSPQRRRARQTRQKQRIQARQFRQKSKQSQAVAQNQAVAKISKSAETDSKLLAQLSQATPPIVTPQPTMSKATKTGLIIGAVAVAGIIGFILYKKFKK
jgi:hypothetical protein